MRLTYMSENAPKTMNKQQENEMEGVLTVAHNDFQKGLNARAFFKVHDHEVGEDLVQDTFTKTWSYLVRGGKYRDYESFSISHIE